MQDEKYLAPHKMNSSITREERQQQEKRNSTNVRRTKIVILKTLIWQRDFENQM
jgi:hypothetical protein